MKGCNPSGVFAGPVDVYLDGQSAGTDVWKKLVKVSVAPDLCSLQVVCDGHPHVAIVPEKQTCPILKTDTPCSEPPGVHVPQP